VPLVAPASYRRKHKALKLKKQGAIPVSKFKRKKRKVLDMDNFNPVNQVPTKRICERVVALAQVISGKEFYPYQVGLAYRITEVVLLHQGDVITALISRQAGKTETIAAIMGAIAVIFPTLAKQFPKDWKLNITDERGVYRGFKTGVWIGIYAPRLDQSEIMFHRIKMFFEADEGKQVLKELKLKLTENNGNTIRLSNGSRILCESASEQSKVEGETHHILICEEAQDISDLKVKKSLHPMVAATLGTIIKIGTSSSQKCDFYSAIKTNERLSLLGGKQNNFFFPHSICTNYNSHYRKYIEKEAIRLGTDSDEFRMSYNCEWIFERGMFLTHDQLFNIKVAQVGGIWSEIQDNGLPRNLSHYSIVAGIDWGKSYDSTVLCLLAVDWLNPELSGTFYRMDGEHDATFYKKHIIYWEEWKGDNYEHQFWEIFNILRAYPNLRKVVTDSNTCGAPIYDRLDMMLSDDYDIEVEGFNFQPRVKSDGYKSFYTDFCGHRITFPAGPLVRKRLRFRKFVHEMLALKKTYKNGMMQVAHPDEKNAHDDYCFPAYAPVLTSRGWISIANVKVGDLVYTRKGLRKVLKAGRTGIKSLIEKFNIVGTAYHPIYNESKGTYLTLDSLMSDDNVLVCLTEKQSSMMERSFTDTRSQNIGICGFITGRIQKTSKPLFHSIQEIHLRGSMLEYELSNLF